MKYKYVTLAIVSLCAFIGYFSVASPGKATAAVAPYGCGLLAPVNRSNSDSNCLNQTYNTGGFVTCTVGNTYGTDNCESANSSQATLKRNFIGDLTWFQNHGQPYQRISAQWIEGKLGGSDWAQRIDLPNVSLTFETNYHFTLNSEYVPQGNNNGYVYYPYAESATARWAIVIKANGVIMDTIKLDCGNLVDTSRTLPNPTTTVQGRVWNWTTGQGYGGMRIFTCISSQPYVTTDANGDFYIRNLTTGTGFCARVASGTPFGMQGPYTRPWGSSYGLYCPGPGDTSPGFGASRSSPLVGGKNYCTGHSSYEYQNAGEYVANNYDRNIDTGYDLVYVLPPPVPQCDYLNVTPNVLDPGTPYQINAGISYQNSVEAAYVLSQGSRLYVDVTGPGVNYNNGNVGKTQNGNVIGGTVKLRPTNNTGDYTVRYGITGTGSIACSSSFYVTRHPVLTTSGGDTEAGAGMSIGGVDCSVAADPYGGEVGWNLGAAGNYAGAGTQYAAFALNYLQDYASAQDGTAGGPGTSRDPTMLSFANDPTAGINMGLGLFGGKFGGGTSCIRDYFAGATNVQYGNVTINGQTVANGTSKAIYVKGNVYITGDIKFSGTYANISGIPSFNIIVEGNIYIAPGVKELDGLYVAEPTSATTGGIIYTCAPSPFTAQPLNATLYNNCGANSLTFNGAIVARQLWLLRAAGSVTGGSAESVNFTPEIWLTTPPDAVSGSSGAGSYDAITSLPPVL